MIKIVVTCFFRAIGCLFALHKCSTSAAGICVELLKQSNPLLLYIIESFL